MRKRKANDELRQLNEYLRKFHALYQWVEEIRVSCQDDGFYNPWGDYVPIPPSFFRIQLLDDRDNLIWSSDWNRIGETSGKQAMYRSLRSFKKELRKFARKNEGQND